MQFEGKNYYLHNSGYYVRDERINGIREFAYLHRDVYLKHHGRIPPGYYVHHIDGDKTNCDIQNLLALPAFLHTTMHCRENGFDSPQYIQFLHQKRREWIRTPAGLKVMKEASRKRYSKPPNYKRECQVCGDTFMTYNAYAVNCSARCRRAKWRMKQRDHLSRSRHQLLFRFH